MVNFWVRWNVNGFLLFDHWFPSQNCTVQDDVISFASTLIMAFLSNFSLVRHNFANSFMVTIRSVLLYSIFAWHYYQTWNWTAMLENISENVYYLLYLRFNFQGLVEMYISLTISLFQRLENIYYLLYLWTSTFRCWRPKSAPPPMLLHVDLCQSRGLGAQFDPDPCVIAETHPDSDPCQTWSWSWRWCDHVKHILTLILAQLDPDPSVGAETHSDFDPDHV